MTKGNPTMSIPTTSAQEEEDRGAPPLSGLKTPHARQLRSFTNETSKQDPPPCLRHTPNLQSSPVHEEGRVGICHRCQATSLDQAAPTSCCKPTPPPAYRTPKKRKHQPRGDVAETNFKSDTFRKEVTSGHHRRRSEMDRAFVHGRQRWRMRH